MLAAAPAWVPGRAAQARTLLQRMAESQQPPPDASPGRREPGRDAGATFRVPAVVVSAVAVVAGTAVLGALTGVAWAAAAPRALVIVVGRGSADVVNPETSAFIAADGWFTLLTVIGGVISGVLGYLLAVRRHGAPAMAAVLAGGVAAALLARWVGQQSGTAAFNSSLLAGRAGLLLHAPLMLGGVGVLAFWALAAGLTAGGIEAAGVIRERQAARARMPSQRPAPAAGAEPPPGP
jgi:hypothetical protein